MDSKCDDLVQASADGVFAVDAEGRFVLFSSASERLTGRQASEVLGKKGSGEFTSVSAASSIADALAPGSAVLHGKIGISRRAVRMRRPDGQVVSLSVSYVPLSNASGGISSIMGVITEQSHHDELKNAGEGLAHAPMVVGPTEPLRPEVLLTGVASASGDGPSDGRLDAILAGVERREILDALRQARGQRTQAAKALGISRSRLYRRMEALGIDPRQDV